MMRWGVNALVIILTSAAPLAAQTTIFTTRDYR